MVINVDPGRLYKLTERLIATLPYVTVHCARIGPPPFAPPTAPRTNAADVVVVVIVDIVVDHVIIVVFVVDVVVRIRRRSGWWPIWQRRLWPTIRICNDNTHMTIIDTAQTEATYLGWVNIVCLGGKSIDFLQRWIRFFRYCLCIQIRSSYRHLLDSCLTVQINITIFTNRI